MHMEFSTCYFLQAYESDYQVVMHTMLVTFLVSAANLTEVLTISKKMFTC